MATRKITLLEFNGKVRSAHGWNAAIGFWTPVYHQLYVRGTLTLEQALGKFAAYADYAGVPTGDVAGN